MHVNNMTLLSSAVYIQTPLLILALKKEAVKNDFLSLSETAASPVRPLEKNFFNEIIIADKDVFKMFMQYVAL